MPESDRRADSSLWHLGFPFNSFRVTNVSSASVAFEKDSNRETITIPIQRIEDVLDIG